MNFACELMDLCRGTQEVEAVLSEGEDKETVRDPLSRLKMAMEYEEKKVRCSGLLRIIIRCLHEAIVAAIGRATITFMIPPVSLLSASPH